MVLRRLTVALLVLVTPVVFVAGPARAADYPPKPPTNQVIVAPGVVYGGAAAGAKTISGCDDELAVSGNVAPGDVFLLKVCGFMPGSSVDTSVRPQGGTKVFVAAFVADGDGAVVAGPFRLTAPGRYVFFVAGVSTDVEGAGVGGVGNRGASRVLADPNRVVQLALTVPGAVDVVLPKTGGDGGGGSAAGWGVGSVLLGAALLLLAAVRRRAARGRRRRHRVSAPA